MSTADTPPVTPLLKQRDESVAREKAKKEFWDVVFDNFSKINSECNKYWSGPDAADFAVERGIFREHVEILEHGVVMSLVVFGTLRLTAHPKFEPFAARYIKPIFRLTPAPVKKKAPQYASSATDKIISKSTPPTINPKYAAVGGRHFKSFLEKQRDTHVQRIEQAAEGRLFGLASYACNWYKYRENLGLV